LIEKATVIKLSTRGKFGRVGKASYSISERIRQETHCGSRRT